MCLMKKNLIKSIDLTVPVIFSFAKTLLANSESELLCSKKKGVIITILIAYSCTPANHYKNKQSSAM